MSDKKECRLDAPTKNILISFQGKVLYFISDSALTLENEHSVTIRVDKNTAQEFDLRVVNPYLVAIDSGEQLDLLVSQFLNGTLFKVRILSLKSIQEDKGTLVGFKSEYEKFKNCISQ